MTIPMVWTRTLGWMRRSPPKWQAFALRPFSSMEILLNRGIESSIEIRVEEASSRDGRDCFFCRRGNPALSGQRGASVMDFSNMSFTDWMIRVAILGVLASAVIGTLQNLIDAIRNKNSGV